MARAGRGWLAPPLGLRSRHRRAEKQDHGEGEGRAVTPGHGAGSSGRRWLLDLAPPPRPPRSRLVSCQAMSPTTRTMRIQPAVSRLTMSQPTMLSAARSQRSATYRDATFTTDTSRPSLPSSPSRPRSCRPALTHANSVSYVSDTAENPTCVGYHEPLRARPQGQSALAFEEWPDSSAG